MMEPARAGATTLPYANYERVRFSAQLYSDLAKFS